MNFLKEIKDKDFPKDESGAQTREAARAIIFDEQKMIPILFVSKYEYHKLPGGGINEGEDEMQALKREAKEETGCEIEVFVEIGKIIEYKTKNKFEEDFDLKQISTCYIGKIIKKGENSLTKKEIKNGFKLIWLSLDEAIETLKNDSPKNLEGKFIRERDLRFLQEAKEKLEL